MAAGGIRRPARSGNSELLNIDVIGRNFDAPTQFNMAHKYRTTKDFVQAFLVKELPPLATIAGHFRLNGASVWTPFGTIERGTAVDDVRITVTGASQVNSPDLKEVNVSGGATPASFMLPEGTRNSGSLYAYDSNIAINQVKSYSARSKDMKDVLSAQVSASFAYGVRAYYGRGNVTGAAITETWVRANLTRNATWNAHMASVTVTPSADDYILYLAPVSWGLKVFEFLGSDQTNPEAATRVRIRTDAEILNNRPQSEATEYFVIRSLGKGLGGGFPYTFQIGNIG